MARSFASASSQSASTGVITVPARPVTMACWFRPTTLSTVQVIFGFSDSGNNNLQRLRVGGASTNQLGAQEFNSPTNEIAESSNTMSAGTWHHCGGVFASATSRSVYLDGTKVTNTNSCTPTGLDRLLFCRNAADLQFGNGRMAEAAVWDVALDDAEMTALAKGICPLLIRPASLVAYYPLVGNDSPEPDRWKNRYDLTLTNGPTKADHPRIYYPATPHVFMPSAAAPANTGAMFAMF